jgi:amino acid transporter
MGSRTPSPNIQELVFISIFSILPINKIVPVKKLERSLSLPYVVAIAIGGMLGSGIFVLPGLAAAKTGPSVWLAYLLAGVCILPAVFSKSELATAMPTSGGTYVYIERTFGPI